MAEDGGDIIVRLDAEDNASQKIDNVTKSMINLDRQSRNMNSSGNDGGIYNLASKIEHGVTKINNVTRRYNATMSGFNRTVIRGIREMGSAVYDFTTDAINNFTKFSEQHAKTLGAMANDYDNTKESQAKFFADAQKLKDQAIQLGTYGVNGSGSMMDIQQVSQAQTELVKAGVSASEIADPKSNITSDVLKFAQANELDTETAVEFAVTLGNQFGVDKKDWGTMLDKVSHTADMSVIDVKDVITSMKWASGISAGLDRDYEEILGMISVLGDFGLKGSQGGTGIQALLTRLLTGDTTVITAAQAEVAPGNALEKFYEFEKKAKPDGNLLPMSQVIDELDKTMADMTDEEQAWFAKKLFGLYQMKSAYALMNGNTTDLDKIVKEIKEQSEGTNSNKLEQLLKSQYGQLTSLNNLWEGIKTDIGDRVSPLVSKIRDELYNFLKNDGNYDIDFGGIKDALDESCNAIEEKYGSAIANAVREIGDVTIDLSQIGTKIAPELGSGLLETFQSLFSGDLMGTAQNWGEMIDNMHEAIDELPEDVQSLGDAVVDTIDWFGKLCALNVTSEIAELISSVLQILTIAGGAVIKVAGSVVVNGNTVNGGTGSGGTGTGTGNAGNTGAEIAGGAGGASAGSAGASVANSLKGSTVVGSADDVAKLLGTSADDVTSTFGKQASYTIDDIARGLGTSSDDIIKSMSSEIDELVKAGALSVDEVAVGGSKLFKSLSKTGKALGAFGILLQTTMSGYEAVNDFSSGDAKGGVEAISGGAGSLGGAYAGATIGTAIFPGIGSIIGAIAGGMGGDELAREFSGAVYDNFNDALANYGTALAGLPITGGLFQKDGTIAQQKIQKQRDDSEIKPSDYGMPKVFDKSFDPKTGEIYFDSIINALQNAKDYPTTWGRYENKYGMDVDEAKQWQNSNEYKEYKKALADAKEEANEYAEAQAKLNKQLSTQMITVKKGDAGYDESMDTANQGYYEVWGGSRADLQKYLDSMGSRLLPSDYGEKKKVAGATEDNPYILNELSNDIRQAIISGFQQSNKNKSGKSDNSDKDGDKNANSVTINSKSTNLTGQLDMPDMSSVIKKLMPSGYAALSDKGQKDLIKNEVNNQIQIDDTVTMQPQFNVSAPNVNVDVKVDKEEKVTKNVTILNPGQGKTLNNWYSRTSSQYGKTIK